MILDLTENGGNKQQVVFAVKCDQLLANNAIDNALLLIKEFTLSVANV